MPDETRALYRWLTTATEAVDTGGLTLDEDAVRVLLDLARDAAHNTVRPAAPLTTFLAGVAVGRGHSLEPVAQTLSRLALDQAG